MNAAAHEGAPPVADLHLKNTINLPVLPCLKRVPEAGTIVYCTFLLSGYEFPLLPFSTGKKFLIFSFFAAA
jgi:hypothetical protein